MKMKTKTLKTGLIASATLATLAISGGVLASTMTSSATSTDVVTGPTSIGSTNTAYFMLTAPKTVTVSVGTSADDLKSTIGAFAQYANDSMINKGEYSTTNLEEAKNGVPALELLGPSNSRHSKDIITVSSVDTSKAGTYTATVTADGSEAGQQNASVPVTVVVTGDSTTTSSSTTSPSSSTTAPSSTKPSSSDKPSTTTPTVKTIPVYRLYAKTSGDHFYTTSLYEATQDMKHGWSYENIAFNVQKSGKAVYRVYNAKSGEHLFTTDAYEKSVLVKAGWKYEGIAWYGANKGIAVYRGYNPKSGQHLYTTSSYELKVDAKYGWKNEGVAWYGISNNNGSTTTPQPEPSQPTKPSSTKPSSSTDVDAGASTNE